MKKYIITTYLLALTLSICAQQLPNSSFEDWSAAQFDGNIQPKSWNVSNVTQFGFKFNFAHREAGHTGNYCLMVKDQEVGAAGITEVSPGYFALGQPWVYIESLSTVSQATAGTYGGINFAYRPDSLVVWIKRTGTKTNLEYYNIVFYSWKGTSKGASYKGKNGSCTSVSSSEAFTVDEESDIRQATDGNECATSTYATQIAEGWVKEKVTYNDWTQIKVPIYYNSNEVPTKCNIIFSAGNYPNFRANSGLYNNNAIYVDDVSLVYSANIDELYVNNKKWGGFDPKKNNGEEQTYALGLGATAIPEIFAKRGVGSITNCKGTTANFSGRVLSGSEITIDQAAASVGGSPVIITVRAEDGSKTSTYKIKFVAEQSSNNRPAAITYTVNGVTSAIPNFSGYITNYSVDLPYGTTAAPTVEAVKGDDGQTITITQATSPTGTATVKVVAANGASNTYTITFAVGKLTDNTLAGIKVGNNNLPGFSPTKTNYVVELPLGTSALPVITPISAYNDGEQTITINNGVTISGDNCSGTYNISVSAPGNSTVRTYKLSFKITASTYSFLSDLKIDGVTIDGWDAENVFNYYYTLPLGTTALPAITYTKGDSYQTVAVDASGISGTDGTYKITVTAASGAQSIYKIVFSTLKSSVSTLNAIYLDGTLLPDFAPNTFNYTHELPIGTTALPAITCTPGDAYQNAPVIISNGVNGTTRIIVQAQNGATSTYTIAFSVKQANNTSLKSLIVEGYSLDFDAAQYDYYIVLRRGTTTLPTITYEANDEFQKITRKDGGVNGDTKIIVKAQNGATATYTIHFSVAQSSDATLNDIKIDGQSLELFDKDTLDYYIELPSGTTSLPTITYTKGDAAQIVQLYKGDLDSVTTLVVTAEDGTTRTYSLHFTVVKSANAYLQQIFIDGEPIEGFDPSIFAYTYLIDTANTKNCPNIDVVKNAGQSITIVKPRLLGTATITVNPEIGAPNYYTITFTGRLQNHNSLLENILIDGRPLDNFDANTLIYSVELPSNDIAEPTITPVKGDNTQVVWMNEGGINGTTTIIVKAEDGTTTTYSIVFTAAKSNDATLKSIRLNGTPIAGFASNILHYENTLPDNATAAPIMTFEGNAKGQTFVVSEPALTGIARIVVTAEDGITTNTYSVTHRFAPLTDATIGGISVNGTQIADFEPNKDNYTIAIDNDASMDIALDIDSTQYIAIANANTFGTEIVVLSESGNAQTYNIAYNSAPSSSAELKDLQLFNGTEFVSIDGFDSAIHTYTDTLEWRTKEVPVVNPVPAHERQTITIYYNTPNDTTLVRVTAEDGTTADYTIYFPVRKSTLTALDNIVIDNTELSPEFDADVLSYTAHLPYGTTQVPTIRWEKGKIGNLTVDEQRITLKEAGLCDTARITVTAENGDTRTYNISFEVAESTAENMLNYYIVDGIGMITDLDATITLPYGSNTLPKITCVKKYEEQSVLIDNGGIYAPTTITVKANRADVADAIYTLNPVIAKPQAALSQIFVNGTAVDGFDPDKHQYIVSVDNAAGEVPAVTYEFDNEKTAIDNETSSIKRTTIEVAGKEDNSVATYTIYFYYTQDTIPNPNFDEWSAANIYTSASKPTGWNALADFTDAQKITSSATIAGLPIGSLITKGTFTPGSEVVQDGDYVKLATVYNSVISGSIPGAITLGEMTASLNDGSSATSIFGGITFRNTPDAIAMRYNPVSQSGVRNMYFAYSVNNGIYLKEHIDADFNNTWKTMQMSLMDNTIDAPSMLNLTINSCESDNTNALKSKAESTVLVDWVRLTYNSKIATIYVNGTAASGFQGNYDKGWVQAIKIDAETQGLPVITFKGETDDQEYTYTISEELENCSGDYKTRIANITSKGEDGSLSHYIVNLNRPLSQNANLAGIIVGEDTLDHFAPNTFDYEIEVPNGTRRTPDIMVIRGNMHQRIELICKGLNDTIVVTAENGKTQKYALHFVERKSDDATLQNIIIEGEHPDFTYDAATTNYHVTLAANATLPEVTFTKRSDGQTVVVAIGDTTTIDVTAENGIEQQTYTIAFTRETPLTSSQLAHIGVVATTPFTDFDRETYDYHYASNTLLATTFERADATDTVVQVLTHDAVVWHINGSTTTHTYNLHFDYTPSADTNLAQLLINSNALAAFNPNIHEYIVDTNQPLVVEAVTNTTGQHASASFELFDSETTDGTYALATFVVTAEDNVSTSTYKVFLRRIKSSNALLAGILLNNEMLATNTSDYTSDYAFASTQTDYNIALRCANPKLHEPEMPTITVRAGDVGQNIQIENNGLNATSYITVVAEDGTETIYTLNLSSEKSSNADLTAIAIDYVALPQFDANETHYVVDVVSNELPEISYSSADRFQQRIETELNATSATITVVAEDGTTKTYAIEFNLPAKSDNAQLEQIEIDGTPIDGFAADSAHYDIMLPIGTETLPNIVAIIGHDGQAVSIDCHNGLRDTTTITVTAEDGTTQQIYTIYFDVELSDNAALDMIYLYGDSLLVGNKNFASDRDFASDELVYNITLPIGTRAWPTITYAKGHKGQNVVVDTLANADYSAQFAIDVTAEKGNSQRYLLNLTIEKSAIDTLRDIYIGDESLELIGDHLTYTADHAFAGDIVDYHLTWQVGSRDVPTISYEAGDKYQTVEIVRQLTSLNDTATINVTAENGRTRTYNLYNELLLSHVDTLAALFFDGVPYTAYTANIHTYDSVMPYGTTALPAISWENGDKYQTVVLDSLFTDLEGYYSLTVTAEDGTQTVYVFNFSVAKSNNALLNNIFVDGEPINGFMEDVANYTITIPYGTTDIPQITWALGDPNQDVQIVAASSINDTVTLIVTAEDGITIMAYHIAFVQALADNALLDSIFIGGEAINEEATGFVTDNAFSAELYEYHITLPYGTTTLPAITWQTPLPETEYHSITLTNDDDAVHGTSVIAITSQDEMHTNEYYLHFSVALSDNARLLNLYFEGAVYPDFEPLFHPDSTNYTLTFAVGTSEADYPTLEHVRYVKSNDDQTVAIAYAKTTENVVLTDTTVTLTHEGIWQHANDDTLAGTTVEAGTTITIAAGDTLLTTIEADNHSVIIVTVTAQNGATNVYVVTFNIAKSNNTLLKDILINGLSLKHFEPKLFEYTYLILKGSSMPTIEGILDEPDKQTIEYGENPNNALCKYIYCIAEDGSESVYTIVFAESDDNPGDEPTADDVCWTQIGNGTFKASTSRNGVSVALFDLTGRRIAYEDVPLVDPNDDICDAGAAGVIFTLQKTGKTYICVFYYNGKQNIAHYKFIQ